MISLSIFLVMNCIRLSKAQLLQHTTFSELCKRTICLTTVNFAGGRWRVKHGRCHNPSVESVLVMEPDWSFTDGRGYGPPTLGQRRRYLRDIKMTKDTLKYLEMFKRAKELVPDDNIHQLEFSEHELIAPEHQVRVNLFSVERPPPKTRNRGGVE